MCLPIAAAASAPRREVKYDMCGTYGCILADKHPGLHIFAETDTSSRQARHKPAPAPPPVGDVKPASGRGRGRGSQYM